MAPANARAIEAAAQAFPAWARRRQGARAVLRRWYELLMANLETWPP